MVNYVLLYIFYLIFAYILGSFPSGYIITRLSVKKNILEVGWKKTSGSNVFRNVGKWQAALTGILDIAKGFLAVWLALKLGFPHAIQVLAGVAAICGHNWSFFLKFAGGRGIATYMGVILAFSWKIFILSAIPFLVFSLIINSPIGTIVFLIIVIILSIYFNQFWLSGIFTAISFIPIFIKRLSPIKEIFPIKEKINLIKNRLIFDNDESLEIRIKSYFKDKKTL